MFLDLSKFVQQFAAAHPLIYFDLQLYPPFLYFVTSFLYLVTMLNIGPQVFYLTSSNLQESTTTTTLPKRQLLDLLSWLLFSLEWLGPFRAKLRSLAATLHLT
jgi:hypothetical protein